MSFLLIKEEAKRETGFTLFTVLAAFVLLSLFLSQFIPAVVQIRNGELRSEQRLEAFLLGYGKFQEVSSQAERRQEGRFPAPWSLYDWRIEEERGENLKTQTLTVKWKDLNHERKVQLHNVLVKTH